MITIAAMSPVVRQPSPTVQASAGAVAAPSLPSAAPPSPAVVISISPGTLSAVSYPGDKTAEQRVNSLVEAVKTHNDIADAHDHVAWAAWAKDVGEDRVAAYKAEATKYLNYSAARLGREFGESGIDVRALSDEQAAAVGQAPGTLRVKDFTFKSGGSVYAVTAREDGTLVGTRDGEAWKTWKTIPASTWVGGRTAVKQPTAQDTPSAIANAAPSPDPSAPTQSVQAAPPSSSATQAPFPASSPLGPKPASPPSTASTTDVAQLVRGATLKEQITNLKQRGYTQQELGTFLEAVQPAVRGMSAVDRVEAMSLLAPPAGPDEVVFTFATPDSGTTTTSMSASDLAKALASDDPKSLGWSVSDDGTVTYFRDVLREALGLGPDGKAKADPARPTTDVELSAKDQIAAAIAKMMERAARAENGDEANRTPSNAENSKEAKPASSDIASSKITKAAGSQTANTFETVGGAAVTFSAFPKKLVALLAGGPGTLLNAQA